jgi:hypothetical protein
MTYHVTLTYKLREFWPGAGSVHVEKVRDHFMPIIGSLPEKSQCLISDLNRAFIIKETCRDQRVIDQITGIFKKEYKLTDEEAMERFVVLKKGHDAHFSTVQSNLRSTIVTTSTSAYYEEKHVPYGIMSNKGGYWEFFSKEDYEKRMQDKDKVSIDRLTTRMLVRDPTNQLLQDIRTMVLRIK